MLLKYCWNVVTANLLGACAICFALHVVNLCTFNYTMLSSMYAYI